MSLLEEGWRELLALQTRVTLQATNMLREEVARAQQEILDRTLGAAAAPAANAFASAAAFAVATTGASGTSDGGDGGDWSAALDDAAESLTDRANDAASGIVNGVVQLRGVSRFESFKDAFVLHLEWSSRAGALIAMLTLCVVWVLMLRSYRRRVLEGRRGRYVMVWRKNRISRAVNYVGLMLALSGFGFLLSWCAAARCGRRSVT